MKRSVAESLLIALLFLTSLIGIFLTDDTIATGSTVYVADHGNADYIKIQDAIDSVNSGDTIYVYNGYYFENLIINKTIYLIGEDKSNTTIDGSGDNAIVISTDGAEIRDFTIKNGTNGIMINDSRENTILDNTIMDTNFGVYLDNKSFNNTIYNNNFINNIKNAYDSSSNNWHHLSIGNYWDDYTGSDENDDGIGDTIYNVYGGNNQDTYPLMEPITKEPNAGFTYLPLAPTTQDIIQFNDASIDLDGNIASWSWNFGDGNYSTDRNPTHKYTDDGIYSITLKVTDNYGVVNETAQQISILNVGPTSDFIYSPANPTDLQNVTFTDKSSDSDGSIVNWLWNFGDDNSSVLKNSSHKYGDNGTYTITLIVTDDDGSTDTISQQIIVSNVGPIASFYVSSENNTIIANDKLQFIDTSKDLDGYIISWKWNLGDGTTSTEKYLSHIYSSKGVYKVSLTVIDNDGTSSTEIKEVTVSTLMKPHKIEKGFSTFDIFFVVFIIIMVAMVIFISRKYG